MTIPNKKDQNDLPQKEIKFILELFNSKKLNEAKKEINRKITKYVNSPILFNILGAILGEQNQLNDSIANYKKAIKIDPNYAQAYNNLGIALQKLKKKDQAIDNFKKAISLKNDFVEALSNLGQATWELNESKDALTYFEKAVKIKPNYPEVFHSIAAIHYELGNNETAIDNCQKAIIIKPDYADVYNTLGMIFYELLKFNESLSNYNKAIELSPNNEKFYNNLGNLLNRLGKYEEAMLTYNKAIKIKSDYAKAYSNHIFNLNYITDLDKNLYLSEAKKFGSSCKKIKKNFSTKYSYDKKPEKLRIGLVSSDFGNHPGGFFTLSTLRELRKKNFELITYSTYDRKDEFSHHFRPLFSKWCSIEKKSDEEVVEQIFKDGIHILMDLQGHSANNRLPIFMYKPAPIQVTWLGQGSTGIPEIDYFIGSSHITPKDEEKYYVEKIIRLPEISQCFTPPDYDLEINNLPALKNKFITFGCVNKLSKINNEVIALWSKILLSIKNSKLILKNKDFDDQNTYTNTLKRFEKKNIESNRIILKGESKTRKELLKVYHEIDIALDPFPFQGNTTTCEAIWMGVPVITLKGDRYLFHFGESINSNLNMKDWISENYETYVSNAVKFSSDLEYLSKIRMNLRKKALESPVFDADSFAGHFSNALWDMWKKFVNQKKS